MNVQIRQSSTYVSDRRWDWSIWLAGPTSELDQIDCVTYTLHPTFPNPVRKIRTRRGGFRLQSSGWGEFTIYIDITQKNGEHFQLRHDLKLSLESNEGTASNIKNTFTMKAFRQTIPFIKGMVNAVSHRVIDEAGERLPTTTVFVSGGVADAEAVRRLSNSLRNINVHILSVDDMPSDIPFQIQIDKLIEQSNLAVFLLSGRPSMWMNQEIETAKRHGKRIVPVLLGSERVLPESLQGLNSLHIDRLDSVADIAQSILRI